MPIYAGEHGVAFRFINFICYFVGSGDFDAPKINSTYIGWATSPLRITTSAFDVPW